MKNPNNNYNLLNFKFLKNKRGITLIEVIVSLALLAILLILISGMMMTSLMIATINQQKTKNSLNVADAVGNNSASPGVTVSSSSGTVTVTLGGLSSQVPVTYYEGATSSTSSTTSISGWLADPN